MALAAIAAPLMFAFAWQRGLASMGDDSFSYLTLAQHFAAQASWLDPWVSQHTHLPPLFPLALWLGRGSRDLFVAHGLVALFAVVGLVFVYAFALRVLARRWAALVVVSAFLLTPTAWISIKGILSESLYLLLTFAALYLHAARVERREPASRDLAIFGVLLACVYMTRAAGAAFVAAYAVHAGWRMALREPGRWKLLIPAVPLGLATVLWLAMRPGESAGYQDVARYALESWLDRGASQVPYAARLFMEGWIASFHADVWTTLTPRIIFTAMLAVGIAGAVVRAARNKLDGWYALASLGIIFLWMYPQDTTRRLLYPVLPLLIIQGAYAISLVARPISKGYRRWLYAAAATLPLSVCIPAMVLLAEKSRVRDPVAGTAYGYADITDYYLYVNEAQARIHAGRALATFAGFDGVASATAPGAKVMWVRPEYVALLAQREPVAYENRWDGLTLAREIARTGTAYVIFAEAYKVDVNISMRHPREVLADLPQYAREVFAVANPVTRTREFILYQVDRARLEAYIAGRERRP